MGYFHISCWDICKYFNIEFKSRKFIDGSILKELLFEDREFVSEQFNLLCRFYFIDNERLSDDCSLLLIYLAISRDKIFKELRSDVVDTIETSETLEDLKNNFYLIFNKYLSLIQNFFLTVNTNKNDLIYVAEDLSRDLVLNDNMVVRLVENIFKVEVIQRVKIGDTYIITLKDDYKIIITFNTRFNCWFLTTNIPGASKNDLTNLIFSIAYFRILDGESYNKFFMDLFEKLQLNYIQESSYFLCYGDFVVHPKEYLSTSKQGILEYLWEVYNNPRCYEYTNSYKIINFYTLYKYDYLINSLPETTDTKEKLLYSLKNLINGENNLLYLYVFFDINKNDTFNKFDVIEIEDYDDLIYDKVLNILFNCGFPLEFITDALKEEFEFFNITVTECQYSLINDGIIIKYLNFNFNNCEEEYIILYSDRPPKIFKNKGIYDEVKLEFK